jgi:superfamily II DNA/RNA helicase
MYYDVAFIPDYSTSVMMNKLFRNIKENQNLDALEESDDEEEFIIEEDLDDVKNFLSDSFLLIDECHEINIKNKLLLKFINNSKKAIFSTATLPNNFSNYINSTLKNNEYDFNYALKNNHIVDYKIMIPVVNSSNEIEEGVPFIKSISIAKQCAFLMKGMLQTGSKRCIVYLTTKQECIEFCEVWNKIGSEYHGRNTKSYRINDDTEYKQRKNIINEFESNNDD